MPSRVTTDAVRSYRTISTLPAARYCHGSMEALEASTLTRQRQVLRPAPTFVGLWQ